MRENLVQTGKTEKDGRRFIEYDWHAGGIPPNVVLGENVYLDTSYGFEAFHSEREIGFRLGDASGVYNMASFIVGQSGTVNVGSYTVLGGTFIICSDSVTIGNHCLLAWGSVVTDTWAGFESALIEKRRDVLSFAATDAQRRLLPVDTPRPVVLEDNVWVGFDAVILPGVTLGRGCIVGCKTIVGDDVPPYAVVVGNPARLIRFLDGDDTEEARKNAFQEYLLSR
ncbi:MAG: acyltransferase [Acidobacteriota bacterium]|nr:acyltransferase [Acidobacteriota bacterium]